MPPPPLPVDLEQEEDDDAAPLSKRPRPLPLSTSTPQFSFFFNPLRHSKKQSHEPLYERLRPKTLDDVVGQDHLLSSNSLLSSAIQRNRLPSFLLWGPPGTGKTTIARAIVNSCHKQQQQQQCPCW